MSEQEKPKSFMQELDQWTDGEIVGTLLAVATPGDIDTNDPVWDTAVEEVKKAIRTKVLESYRNGQKAGPSKPARKEPRR